MYTELIQLACALFGSVAFSVLFNVKRTHLFIAALGGVFGWAIYLSMGFLASGEFFRSMVAASAIALFAEVMARVKKAPTTVFLTVAAIPLFPGASLYRTMRCIMSSDLEGFIARGLATAGGAAGIACGILFTMTAWYLVDRIRRTLFPKKDAAPTYCTDSTNANK